MTQIKAKTRDIKGEKDRREGSLPGVVYGAGKDSVAISLVYKDFAKLHENVSESTLIDLELDGKEGGKVLVQDLQFNPVSDRVIHVDLRRIDMAKPLVTYVGLEFVGSTPAVKELGGTFISNIEEVEVRCLPNDLISEIKVDLSSLKTFDDVIKVKNIAVPEGIEIINPEGEALVAKVLPAITEEEVKKMEEDSVTGDISKIESATGSGTEEGESEGEEKKESGKEEKKEEKPEDKKE